ncbi:MAG: glycosyltransferase family 4 protein [Deltaproteobacteria bacterium]|nr:glycosyltransferase family 4 protein [Deltaproteobacteria bacterium]
MKIAMLGLKGVPYPEGIENFTEQVGWRLAERGHRVTVYVRPYVKVGDSYRGMQIRRLPSINTKHFDALTHTFLATLDAARSDVDVVHFHALGPSVFSFIPGMRGIKVVVQVHGLDWQRQKWGRIAKMCLRWAEYAAAYFPDRTVVISETLKNYFEQKYRKHLEYIPTGVEAYPQREPQEIKKWGLEKGKYILFLGRLVPEKGCHYLLKAFATINSPMKLVIAGDGSHSDDYVLQLKQLSGRNVIFTGHVKGTFLEELFSNAYFYVLPSELEGLPHSLLQALSFGKCVLASGIPANMEALGDCGLTFKSGDIEDLRRQMLFLLENPGFVHAQKDKSQARVSQHYGWDAVVDKLERIYFDCLDASH